MPSLPNIDFVQVFIAFLVLLFSLTVHEAAHAWTADWLGDPTARMLGRVSLNPAVHIDPLGTIVFPLIAMVTNLPIIGWAKPVPYNPYNLTRAPRWGETIVAAMGPLTNFALVIVFAILMRVWDDPTFGAICFIGILVNLWLGLLNLIPVPPLDGSKVLSGILPRALAHQYDQWRARMEYNPFLGFGIVLILVVLFGSTIGDFVYSLARAIAGV